MVWQEPTTKIRYQPTSTDTPQPKLCHKIFKKYLMRWVPVVEALPPERIPVLIQIRGDNCPAFAWLKFAAGDRNCPHFICPQIAAMEPRGTEAGKEDRTKYRCDATHWYSPTPAGLPWSPDGYEEAEWGIDGCGWEHRDNRLNDWKGRPWNR